MSRSTGHRGGNGEKQIRSGLGHPQDVTRTKSTFVAQRRMIQEQLRIASRTHIPAILLALNDRISALNRRIGLRIKEHFARAITTDAEPFRIELHFGASAGAGKKANHNGHRRTSILGNRQVGARAYFKT